MDKELKDRLDRIERIVCEINSPLDALVYFAQEVSGLTCQFQSTYLDYGKISEDFQVSPVAWREIILANIIKEWAQLRAEKEDIAKRDQEETDQIIARLPKIFGPEVTG